MLWRPGKHGLYAQTGFASPRRSNILFDDGNRITDGGLISGTVFRDGHDQPAVVHVNNDGKSSNVVDLTKALPIKHATFGEANDANDSNVIVGYRGFSYKGLDTTRATVWSLGKHGAVYESFVDQLGGVNNSVAAVNASGVIAGSSDTVGKYSLSGAATSMAFVATHSRSGWSTTELGLPPGEEATTANDISDNGTIVGIAYRELPVAGTSPPETYFEDRAVMWQLNRHGRYSTVMLNQLLPVNSEWDTLETATRVYPDGSVLGRGWL